MPDLRVPDLRVLVVRIGAMGDVLHGLPAVLALKRLHPHWVVGWAVEPSWRALLEGSGQVVDRLHLVPTRAWKRRPFSVATLRDLLRLRRELREQRYDVCVDLQGSIRSAVIGRMAGARRFVGPARPRERQARALYGERIDVGAEHVIEQACELVGAVAGDKIAPAEVVLPVDPAAESWFARTIAGEGFVLLAPAAGWGAKEWPSAGYAELARRLRARGLRVLVNAASPGDEVARRVADEGGAELVVCDVAQLIALSRRAGLVIGGDTGPVHLAAALGRPVIALFGPTDPARNGPCFPGARVQMLRDPASVTDHRRHAETDAGLKRITVEDVLAAALGAREEGEHG